MLSRSDIIRKYAAFGTCILASCQYTVYTPYNSGIQTECSMSLFIGAILINTIMLGFNIIM